MAKAKQGVQPPSDDESESWRGANRSAPSRRVPGRRGVVRPLPALQQQRHGHEMNNAIVRWAAGLSIAAALGVGVVLYYQTEVCDEQLAPSGEAVTVCRNLQATDPPIVALGLVALVALTAFFSEISGFGISLKRQVQRNTKTADAAISKAADAESAARSAQLTSELAQGVTLDVASARAPREKADAPTVVEQIDQLISQYNDIRAEERTGAGRTSRMTSIVSKMLSTLSGVGLDAFDLNTYLSAGDNDGRRMAAYAYLYANPDPPVAPALVDAILQEPTRFGQYWAIRALRRLVSIDPAALDLNSRRELETLLSRLGPNTDRAYELRQVLAEAQKK
jgi:hypothetical protein